MTILKEPTGLIIKYCEYYIESYDYNINNHNFIDSMGNELDDEYTFIYEEDLKEWVSQIQPYIETYKIIKLSEYDIF